MVMFTCQTCKAENRVPIGHSPRDYFCGQCRQKTLFPDNPGASIACAAIGFGFGMIIYGPIGAVLIGLLGATLARILRL